MLAERQVEDERKVRITLYVWLVRISTNRDTFLDLPIHFLDNKTYDGLFSGWPVIKKCMFSPYLHFLPLILNDST